MTEAERRSLRGLVATLLGNPTPFEAPDLPLALIRRHLLAPLAYNAGVAEFRKDYIASSLQAERRAAVLAEAVDALGDAGISVILLKGIAYAGSLYEDAAERPMSDIDLLVRSSDITHAERVFARLGYWRAGGASQETVTRHAITLKRREGSIDLHRHILHAGRARIDLQAIWQHARPSHIPGALRPRPSHEYLLHVAHIARHEGMVPLVNYVDAARLGRGLSDTALATLAAEFAVSRALAGVTSAISDLRLLRKGPPDRYSFPSAEEILARDTPPRWLAITRKLRLIDDWRGHAGFALSVVRSRLAPLRRRSS